MNRTVLKPGEPIKNLQHFLRLISYYYNTVPAIIPDGVFSEQTKEAVEAFQKTFNLPVTGCVDLKTWEKIISVYNQIREYEEEGRSTRFFPSRDFVIKPNESNMHLYPIQSMLYVLSNIFNNLGKLDITGVHDEKSVNVVKALQDMFEHEPNGIIDKKTFNMISSLYDSFLPNSDQIPLE